MAKYREFTREDWYAWAGAERFSEKKEPFIYEREMNDGGVLLTIIADKNGLGIYLQLLDDSDEDSVGYYKNMRLNSIRAEGEMKRLIEHLEKDVFECASDITYELDHPQDEITKGYTEF